MGLISIPPKDPETWVKLVENRVKKITAKSLENW